MQASLAQRLKPGVSRRTTVLIATLLWGFAGGRVLLTAAHMLPDSGLSLLAFVGWGLLGAVPFWGLVFRRVARRHLRRMSTLAPDRPCLFSFFDLRSYLVMAFMIALGVTARTSGAVPPVYLGPFYVSLGLSLSIAALQFAGGWLRFDAIRARNLA